MLTQLQGLSGLAAKSENAEAKIKSLSEAFSLFSAETSRLESAYGALKEQYRTINSRLQIILENMSQGLLFIALDGTVQTCNSTAEKLLGRKAETMLYRPFSTHFSDDLFGFSLADTLATHSIMEHRITTIGDGLSRRHLDVSTTFISGGDLSTQGLIILFRDVTELRRLELTASRNDRMKELGEMAAALAHEIRNPLGGIKGFASLLKRDLVEDPKLAQMAGYIVEGSVALDRLVTNVLNYSRPLQLQYHTVDLGAVIEEAATFLKADERACGQTQVIVDATAGIILALDSQLFRSALLNLMINSLQAMPDGGTITLKATSDAINAITTVTDTGHGIAPEHLEKIFSPFFTTKSDGNGFGLSEVHKIVLAHNGTIDVSSVVGRGTTFTIRIPLHCAE